MPFVTLGTPAHAATTGKTASDHHAATVAGDLNLADLSERLHGSLATVTADQHHVENHRARHGLGSADGLILSTHFALFSLFSS